MQIVMDEIRVIIIRPYRKAGMVMTAMMVLPSGRYCWSRAGGPLQTFIHCSFQALYEWTNIADNNEQAEKANFNLSWDFTTLPSLLMLVRLSGRVELESVLKELRRSKNVWNPEVAQSDILIV